jgi:DNA-binding XRE family transcriptional regulator
MDMDDYEKYLGEQMQDEAFREEWEALQPEHEVNLMLIKARQDHNLTQKQLAEICGIRQSNLSRIETGAESPSVRTLCKIARGLGKRLQIQFV